MSLSAGFDPEPPHSAPTTMESVPMGAARRTGLIDQVIDQLRNQITTGSWPIGSRIPTEADLAGVTGTSRNTVREAVQSLVHSGLLERRQGSGTYVLAASELAGAVSRRLAGAHRSHVLEVRRTLEVGAARLAAVRRTDADLATMYDLLESRNKAARDDDVDGVVAMDLALHRAIAQAAHNPVLTDLYLNLLTVLHENVRNNLVAHGGIARASEHVGLVEAIAAADADRAASEAACFLDELLEELPAAP